MELPEIDIDELERRIASGAPVVDVREPDEWATGHIDSATLIALATIPDRISDVASDTTVYVVCARGGRSASAVEFLRAEGIDAVNVSGGMMAWVAAGKPCVTDV